MTQKNGWWFFGHYKPAFAICLILCPLFLGQICGHVYVTAGSTMTFVSYTSQFNSTPPKKLQIVKNALSPSTSSPLRIPAPPKQLPLPCQFLCPRTLSYIVFPSRSLVSSRVITNTIAKCRVPSSSNFALVIYNIAPITSTNYRHRNHSSVPASSMRSLNTS